jgi:hypothetical protein
LSFRSIASGLACTCHAINRRMGPESEVASLFLSKTDTRIYRNFFVYAPYLFIPYIRTDSDLYQL